MKSKLNMKLFSIFMVLISIFGISLDVFAASKPSELPSQIKIDLKGDINLIYNTSYPGTDRYKIDANVKYTKQGFYVYCIEANKGTLTEGTLLNFNDVIDDAGVAYIISNGFPNKNWGYDNKNAYGITQAAVWLYYRLEYGIKCPKLDNIVNKNGQRIDDYNGGSNPNHESHLKVDRIWDLYNGAKAAKNKGFEEPKITTNVSNTILTFSDNTLVSNPVTVNLENATEYTVEINGGVVIDSEGNEKNTFKSGEQFRVKTTGDGKSSVSIGVTIKTTGTINKVYSYKPENSGLQKVVASVVVAEKKTVTSGLIFNYTPQNKEVIFSKQDATTGKEVAGATLEVYDESGKLIESWVSTNEPHYIKLNPGKYTLKETIAPEGYILSSETVSFEVKDDGTRTKVVMKNTPKESGALISKVDISNGKELKGATLEVYDESGELIERWVSTNEPHYIKLNPGKYTLKETIAPEGYVLSSETISFEVNGNGSITKVVMENKPYVEVPITDLDASILIPTFGILLMLTSMVMVYIYVKKENVKE